MLKLVLQIKNLTNHIKVILKEVINIRILKHRLVRLKLLIEKGFKISSSDIKKGLLNVVKNTGLLGRWQTLQDKPKVICDTAHNKEGLAYSNGPN